jgi:hypothetical protein
MRALEISIALILLLTAPTLIQAMGVVPASTTTCTAVECRAQQYVQGAVSNFTFAEVKPDASLLDWGVTVLTMAVEFPLYAMFWMLYFLSMIAFVSPALQNVYHVPAALANYLQIGIWMLWMIAYIQWKRGGLGTDAVR